MLEFQLLQLVENLLSLIKANFVVIHWSSLGLGEGSNLLLICLVC